MSWRDQLQPASFRGVAFKVKSAEGIAGRRSARHEYPQRDEAYIEDMGRKAREFTLDAFILGADYMRGRDALLDAVEASGPGLLVHPYRGRFNVAVTECRYTESSDFGGMAKFSLTFVETFDLTQPATRIDTQTQVGSAADAAVLATQGDFEQSFLVSGFPSFVGLAALDVVNSALGSVRGTVLSGFADINVLPGFLSGLTSLQDNAEGLLGLPGDLGARLLSQFGALSGLFSPAQTYTSTRSFSGFGSTLKPVPSTTPARRRQGTNQAAVVNLVKRAAVVESARASSQMTFASRDEAQAVRADLVERLDAESMTAPDPVYVSLTALRTAVVRDITARGADLSRVVNHTPRTTLPSLLVAHQLYGDATRADEIVARNRIRHPGFVPVGRVLEVLA